MGFKDSFTHTIRRLEMTKTPFLVPHTSVVLVAFLSLAPLAVAQHKMQPTGEGSQNKLVQMVREATKQYLDVNSATREGYQPFLGCVSGSDHGAMAFTTSMATC